MTFLDLLGGLVDWLEEMLYKVISLLPASPFTLIDNSPIQPYLGFMNWVLPFDFVVATMTAWVSAIVIFYAWQVVLRWTKAIG